MLAKSCHLVLSAKCPKHETELEGGFIVEFAFVSMVKVENSKSHVEPMRFDHKWEYSAVNIAIGLPQGRIFRV